ncbi:exopolysaccharide biosynthesis polyprenyl glycosylphosphotransferase [Mucilaginibacter sp. RB4R14]|uniref:exopolysaccharide biosynthesis polyprenyl glycosylphosphotransferase n=1 Tax=Mucilaginibacter aurantiaciroseus TaxID=2949308 RepID=UPI002090D1AA|nr:exopolysaccharide biosynthesis polyprenyl glycosylphosphotransferase [Mucilaginibacter aurantiaciroseus]MCO5934653.1 exopolysaccharide biosynthesis polyprenyl glycosylphosphotransferase [Mucilaginibacter aurantiaciroseus]
MNHKDTNLFRIFFSFSDLFALNLISLILIHQFNLLVSNSYDYTVFCLFNNMVWIICSYATGIYIQDKMLDHKRLFYRTFIAFSFFLSIDFVFIVFSQSHYNRVFILYCLLLFLTFMMLSRYLFKLITIYMYKQEEYQKKVIFIGYNDLSKQLITHFKSNKTAIVINGFFDDHKCSSNSEFPILGKINECISYAKKYKITEIYSTLSPKTHPDLYTIAEIAERCFIRFKFIPDLSDFVSHNCHIDFIENTPILSLRREPLESMPGRVKKRLFDIAFSSFIIVFVLSWLIPLLAVFILLDSNGPVFFTQIRSGKKNLPFLCLKLRTLKVNREADTLQVTRDDDRITKVGQFLRKTNLDEMPQFFNVLLGNMSIVGSRPHMLKHTEEYSKLQNDYMARHYIKPGITGWAQVNGHRGEIKHYEQLKSRVEHDIWYLENWNIWLDIRIVFLTLFSTIKGDKNAF